MMKPQRKNYFTFYILHFTFLIILCGGCVATPPPSSDEPLTISMDAVGRMKMDDKYVTMDDIKKRFESDKDAKFRKVLIKGEDGARTERLIALREEIVRLGNPQVRILTARHASATEAE